MACVLLGANHTFHSFAAFSCFFDGGNGTLAVLTAVGERKRTVVSVRLHCWKLTEQVIYIHVPQDWPQHRAL